MSHTLDVVTAVAASAAAIATVGSAIAITWQSVLTRRAVQLQQSVALEGAKQRRDSRGPRVNILVKQVGTAMEPSSTGGEPQPFPVGTIVRLPRDASKVLRYQAVLEAINDGDSTVVVELEPPHWSIYDNAEVDRANVSAHELPARQRRTLQVWFERTVAELLQNDAEVQSGLPMSHGDTAALRVSDQYDDGVIDSWAVRVDDAPFRARTGEDGGYSYGPVHGMIQKQPTSVAWQSERRYFLSKAKFETIGDAAGSSPRKVRRKSARRP